MVREIEIMAPAGNWESLTAALQAGANAVYFGIEQLNMRARATMNFGMADLPKIAQLCNAHQVRSYLTLNTILYDHDLPLARKIIDKAKAVGITAVIAADQAIIAYARSIGFEIHISTQCNITNIETVKFYSLFADVMVLSRELSLRQIAAICSAIEKEQIKGPSGKFVEIEVFAHGALCMAVSGKCYLSLHTQNASANRGACVQNCRRKYKVTDLEDNHELVIDNEYILSPKDLCTLPFLDKLIDAGVKVLKIEGRGKGAAYVKKTTQCYVEAVKAIQDGSFTPEKVANWLHLLEEEYNRGFWGGYYLGKPTGEWTNAPGSLATTRKIYVGKGQHYYPKIGVAEFVLEAYGLAVNDRILITGPTTGVIETTVTSLHVNNDGAKEQAVKGDTIAIPVSQPIRSTDKLYKVVQTAENVEL